MDRQRPTTSTTDAQHRAVKTKHTKTKSTPKGWDTRASQPTDCTEVHCQFANSILNGRIGIHVLKTGRAPLTVPVSLQPIKAKYSVDAEARSQWTRRVTRSTCAGQVSSVHLRVVSKQDHGVITGTIGRYAVSPVVSRQEASELVTRPVHVMHRLSTLFVEASVERERQRTVLLVHCRPPQADYAPR